MDKENSFGKLPEGVDEEQAKAMKKMGDAMQAQMRQEQNKKVKSFKQLNAIAKKGGILFTGSSLMEQFPVCEMCMDAGFMEPVYNRGIGGFTTDDFIENIDAQLLDLEPSKIFINIGTNDMMAIYGEKWMERLLNNYRAILTQCKEKLPDAEVYMMAYYPVNDHMPDRPFYSSFMFQVRNKKNLALVNAEMEKLAAEFGYHFINVNDGLTDENGDLKEEYTIEGVHMYPDAYRHVFRNLKPYLMGE